MSLVAWKAAPELPEAALDHPFTLLPEQPWCSRGTQSFVSWLTDPMIKSTGSWEENYLSEQTLSMKPK
jgi:hypothetical protein